MCVSAARTRSLSNGLGITSRRRSATVTSTAEESSGLRTIRAIQ